MLVTLLRVHPFRKKMDRQVIRGVYARLRGLCPAMTPNWINPTGIGSSAPNPKFARHFGKRSRTGFAGKRKMS
jgi:hypothetical protein